MGELYGEDDSLFQGFLCNLQTGNVVPFNIRFVHNDRICQTSTKLLDLCVLFAVLILPTETSDGQGNTEDTGWTVYFFPAALEPPLTTPFAPTAFFFGFSPVFTCCFNASALVRYSLIFDRISCLAFSFFSSG